MYLTLDAYDIAPYIKANGYSISYKNVVGPNSFTTLDGVYHEDIIAKKAVISAALIPLATSVVSEIAQMCDTMVTATYFDSKTNDYITINAKATMSVATVVINKDSIYYWGGADGIVITIEEK